MAQRWVKAAGATATVLSVLPLLLTGCGDQGSDPGQETRAAAADLARQDVGRTAESWSTTVRAALDAGRSTSAARAAGRQAVVAAPVPYVAVLDDEAIGERQAGELALAVTVVDQADGGGGGSATHEIVRMCVLLVEPVASSGTSSVRDLPCPATLPGTVPGLGTVTATVPYP